MNAGAEVTLRNDVAQATIALRGAELRDWRVNGVALIWDPDPALWPETAPILFPVVGWTRGGRIMVGGQTYPLGLHGFARHLDFSVREHWPSHVRLVATANDATRALYPFEWELEVEHALDGRMLTTRLGVRNLGSAPIPYACGLHPGFRWPFAGGAPEDYAITFGEREAGQVPVISPDGLFTSHRRKVPLDGRRLPLSPALMAREALCFLEVESRSLRLGHPGSGAAIDVALDGFPHVALWSRGPFLCIEPWTGYGDAVDASGHIEDKPSMRWLAAGATAAHGANFTFVPPHTDVVRRS